MTTLARSLPKAAFFIFLLFISIRYIYAPLSLIPSWNQHYSLVASDALGFHDVELFDVTFGSSTGAIISFSIYALLMLIYRRLRERKRL